MITRKPNIAQQMNDLRNEIANIQQFVESASNEVAALDEVAKTRLLTKQERKHLQNLIDYVHERTCWLIKARRTLQAFYAPASA